MITLADYFMGRREQYPLALTPEIERNAARTVALANELIVLAKGAGFVVKLSPRTGSLVSSGWRPPQINSGAGGAARSRHLSGEACDLYDPDNRLDAFCFAQADRVLKDLGLWLESPTATPGWCHVQTKPPRSGRRVFLP